MSGGHWDYQNDSLANATYQHCYPDYDLADEQVKELSIIARKENPLGDKDLSMLLYDLLCVLHSCDWYRSGNIDKEQYKKDIQHFKEKWLWSKEWIRVSDHYPEMVDVNGELKSNPVLVASPLTGTDIAQCYFYPEDGGKPIWKTDWCNNLGATHWMPLPEAPSFEDSDYEEADVE